MRRFAKDVFFTLLFVIVIDYSYGTIVKNVYSEKYSYVKQHSHEIKKLVLGNSLAETGFNTSVLGDSAWCFAISGRTLYYDAKIVEDYLPMMKNLQTIVLTLHYNLHTDVLLDTTFLNSRNYYIYNNFRFLHIPDNTFPQGWLYRSALLSDQMHVKNNQGATFDDYGNTLKQGYYNGERQTHNPPHQSNMNNCIKYLTKMAKICSEHSVRFIVITPPFPDTWLKECSEQGIKNLTVVTDSVSKVYPLEYKNYLQDSGFRRDSLYYNWNHLNQEGATMFALRVKTDFGL